MQRVQSSKEQALPTTSSSSSAGPIPTSLHSGIDSYDYSGLNVLALRNEILTIVENDEELPDLKPEDIEVVFSENSNWSGEDIDNFLRSAVDLSKIETKMFSSSCGYESDSGYSTISPITTSASNNAGIPGGFHPRSLSPALTPVNPSPVLSSPGNLFFPPPAAPPPLPNGYHHHHPHPHHPHPPHPHQHPGTAACRGGGMGGPISPCHVLHHLSPMDTCDGGGGGGGGGPFFERVHYNPMLSPFAFPPHSSNNSPGVVYCSSSSGNNSNNSCVVPPLCFAEFNPPPLPPSLLPSSHPPPLFLPHGPGTAPVPPNTAPPILCHSDFSPVEGGGGGGGEAFQFPPCSSNRNCHGQRAAGGDTATTPVLSHPPTTDLMGSAHASMADTCCCPSFSNNQLRNGSGGSVVIKQENIESDIVPGCCGQPMDSCSGSYMAQVNDGDSKKTITNCEMSACKLSDSSNSPLLGVSQAHTTSTSQATACTAAMTNCTGSHDDYMSLLCSNTGLGRDLVSSICEQVPMLKEFLLSDFNSSQSKSQLLTTVASTVSSFMKSNTSLVESPEQQVEKSGMENLRTLLAQIVSTAKQTTYTDTTGASTVTSSNTESRVSQESKTSKSSSLQASVPLTHERGGAVYASVIPLGTRTFNGINMPQYLAGSLQQQGQLLKTRSSSCSFPAGIKSTRNGKSAGKSKLRKGSGQGTTMKASKGKKQWPKSMNSANLVAFRDYILGKLKKSQDSADHPPPLLAAGASATDKTAVISSFKEEYLDKQSPLSDMDDGLNSTGSADIFSSVTDSPMSSGSWAESTDAVFGYDFGLVSPSFILDSNPSNFEFNPDILLSSSLLKDDQSGSCDGEGVFSNVQTPSNGNNMDHFSNNGSINPSDVDFCEENDVTMKFDSEIEFASPSCQGSLSPQRCSPTADSWEAVLQQHDIATNGSGIIITTESGHTGEMLAASNSSSSGLSSLAVSPSRIGARVGEEEDEGGKRRRRNGELLSVKLELSDMEVDSMRFQIQENLDSILQSDRDPLLTQSW